MALSNSQYDSIIRDYQKQQLQNKHEQDERVARVYEKIPVMRELEDSISTAAVRSARRLLDGDSGALKALREELSDLREQKELLLKANGFPADYMEMHYRCPDCRDTGYVDGRKCHCFRQAQMKLLYAQSNIEEIVRRENFDTFSYRYFDDSVKIPGVGETEAEHMREVVKLCRQFIEAFQEEKGNLLFTGTTGVGKTFLTNCIAKELMELYYSVIYLSANDLFDVFSKNKFSYQDDDEMKDMYEFILDCDLLIIDDLGTELNNSFTSSQLFYCINERLIRKKGTIISTNLSLNMLQDLYTDRVASRIMSNYRMIPLYGEDIRIKKRRKGLD
ncbi:ATP-binding protein [Clostridium sp. AM58-1XD]|uniref:ATP-binding protein n=1 Tax=Clostridium sp. AM58-1XD TaxID=2292307 RepID=UPI000E4A7C7B|nr:ATP-binding protein [Clostridium sp. AM58-1XD]RGY97687.1 DNA replication protein DnaC [Clostridium sp. AM58-1XD]